MDFVYVFNFNNASNVDRACKRLQCSINSVRRQTEQPSRIIVGNFSPKICIKNKVTGVDVYEHKPIEGIYNKPFMINYTVKKYVQTEYFLFSDIDLVYSENYIQHMSKHTQGVARPVRVIPYNHNVYKEAYYDSITELRKLNHDNSGGFAHGNGLIHLDSFKQIRGYDQFYCGYGPEDDDMNKRISFINTLIYDKNIVSFHIYHPVSDASRERDNMRYYHEAEKRRKELTHPKLNDYIANRPDWGGFK